MSHVTDAINEVIAAINNDPYLVHTESDIRSLLYVTLLQRFSKRFEISRKNKAGKPYTTTLVHTEYGRGNRGRIDTVVLNENDITNANWPNWLAVTLAGGRYRPVLIEHAIEIKKCLGGETNDDPLKKEFAKDVQTLSSMMKEKLVHNGHMIFFCRWENARPQNKQRVREFVRWAEALCLEQNLNFYCNDFESIFL